MDHPPPRPDPTPEGRRLDALLVPGRPPLAAQVLHGSGLGQLVAAFVERLGGCRCHAAAARVAREHGRALWDTAVARAQGSVGLGTLDPYDDRPLYWARLAMTSALRSLDANHPASARQRDTLVRVLDRASRGVPTAGWPSGGETRAMVSGFDPFGLEDDLRRSNPSGAAALQLHGRTLPTPAGPVAVRAVLLPVDYAAFDDGIVEDAFGPVLAEGAERADVVLTISQGVRGRMDVERWAANARCGSPDTNGVVRTGAIPAASGPSGWAQPPEPPEWIETTLPYDAMLDARTGPWPVAVHGGVLEWPAGTFPDPGALRRADGPSPGSTAAAGSGGSYLSNEAMYRTNRLRLGLGATEVLGGHLHVSAPALPDPPGALTSAAFEADRRAVVDQTVALVRAAAAAVRSARRAAV